MTLSSGLWPWTLVTNVTNVITDMYPVSGPTHDCLTTGHWSRCSGPGTLTPAPAHHRDTLPHWHGHHGTKQITSETFRRVIIWQYFTPKSFYNSFFRENIKFLNCSQILDKEVDAELIFQEYDHDELLATSQGLSCSPPYCGLQCKQDSHLSCCTDFKWGGKLRKTKYFPLWHITHGTQWCEIWTWDLISWQ